MKIIQLLHSVNRGDAVSNHALALHQILLREGFEASIYALHAGPGIPEDTVQPFSFLPQITDRDAVICHASIGSNLHYEFAGMRGRKILIFHNITPPSFFRPYSRALEVQSASGYAQIRALAKWVDYFMADSVYNKECLEQMGYRCPIDVCPVLIPFEQYDARPNGGVLEKYSGGGWKNLLFVGRIAPNKKQEDVIRAFCCYQRDYNPRSRLFLVGSDRGMEAYRRRLDAYAAQLGLQDRVIFTGHIPFEEILAYYRLSDLLLCMSDHEGFCVPLLEAMHFRKPIIACRAAAVPETLRDGGLLLENRDPAQAAFQINRVLTDPELVSRMAANQERILKDYAWEPVRERFLACLETALRLPARIG